MPTMKKFWKYLINFIVLMILVNVLVWFSLKMMKNKQKANTEENNSTSVVQEK